MLKNKKGISINVLSVLLILVSLFACSFYGVNAWFSQSSKHGIEIYVEMTDLMINVYQNENGISRLIEPMSEGQGGSHVNFDGKIIPGETKHLELILGNDNLGSADAYIRFKFDLYCRGESEDVLVETELYGVVEQTLNSDGFKLDEQTGYYYYCSKTGDPVKIQSGLSLVLMEGFLIDYDDCYNSGNLIKFSGETLYVVLTIDANLEGWTDNI